MHTIPLIYANIKEGNFVALQHILEYIYNFKANYILATQAWINKN